MILTLGWIILKGLEMLRVYVLSLCALKCNEKQPEQRHWVSNWYKSKKAMIIKSEACLTLLQKKTSDLYDVIV